MGQTFGQCSSQAQKCSLCVRRDREPDEYTRDLLADGISISSAAPAKKLSLSPELSKREGITRELSIFEIQTMIADATVPVVLHVYAVGHAGSIQNINRIAQNWLHQGGLFHGAIEVYDKEWSFGATEEDVPGIFACEPRRCSMHTYRESVYLGDCDLEPHEVVQILRAMLPDWMGTSYDLLRKNCCTFSSAFAQRLGVGDIPEWVHHLADTGAGLSHAIASAVRTLHKVEETVVEDCEAVLSALQPKPKPEPKNKSSIRVS
mmetsp:Transcript_95205/g.269066  ORF Transcript_95205/g.269066 Transcript_95205/m.269066 type:complete len:262 (+) Transcript_95205:108-893(+)